MQLPTDQTLRKVLFLCTGNYYRSRFSEYVFNHKAKELKIRGIALEFGENNFGPMSKRTLQELKSRGIKVQKHPRYPKQVDEKDLEIANIIIALCEDEHKLMMKQRYPLWVDKIIYWNVYDLDRIRADVAYMQIEI